MIRWSKVLKQYYWEQVRPWVTQFTTFLKNVELTEGQTKVLLLQHVEGPVLAFIETLVEDNNVLPYLNPLLQYGKLSDASIMRKLFQVKQASRESVVAIVIRFGAASLELGVSEDRLREAFLNTLTS